MSDNFNALVINQEGEKFSREIKKIDKSFLKHGDVLVKKPKEITSRQAMMLGTAGLTAIQCAFTTKQTREVLLLGEKVNDVIVTGASGGV